MSAVVELVVDIDDVQQVLADSLKFQQIITNICTNASQAVGPLGGLLTIKVSETDLTDILLENNPHLSAGKYVTIYFQDTGPGIDPAIIGSIFDPYFSTRHHGDGTGLGLAVTYGIVREMGGQ